MRYRLVKSFPGCKWDIGDIVTDKEVSKEYKKLDSSILNEFFESVNEDSIQFFANGWKPLRDLVYSDIQNKKLWIWCEFPAGGEARELSVKMLTDDPYIYCDVIFEHSQVRNSGQGAVCYSLKPNDKFPYTSETHQEIWREIVKITSVRTITYKRSLK